MIACLFLSAAEDLKTVTVDISVSCISLSIDAMVLICPVSSHSTDLMEKKKVNCVCNMRDINGIVRSLCVCVEKCCLSDVQLQKIMYNPPDAPDVISKLSDAADVMSEASDVPDVTSKQSDMPVVLSKLLDILAQIYKLPKCASCRFNLKRCARCNVQPSDVLDTTSNVSDVVQTIKSTKCYV